MVAKVIGIFSGEIVHLHAGTECCVCNVTAKLAAAHISNMGTGSMAILVPPLVMSTLVICLPLLRRYYLFVVPRAGPGSRVIILRHNV